MSRDSEGLHRGVVGPLVERARASVYTGFVREAQTLRGTSVLLKLDLDSLRCTLQSLDGKTILENILTYINIMIV